VRTNHQEILTKECTPADFQHMLPGRRTRFWASHRSTFATSLKRRRGRPTLQPLELIVQHREHSERRYQASASALLHNNWTGSFTSALQNDVMLTVSSPRDVVSNADASHVKIVQVCLPSVCTLVAANEAFLEILSIKDGRLWTMPFTGT